MNVNDVFEIRVKCTNPYLIDYINSALVYGVEIIPGLEFCGMVEHKPIPTTQIPISQTLYKEKVMPQNKHIHNQNAAHNQNNYSGGWVDVENRNEMQNMFNAFRI